MSVESADPKLTYGELWHAVPRHMGYLAPGVFLAMTVPILIWTLLAPGVGLLILWVGFPLVMGALYLAKAFGSLEINRLAGAGARPIPRPTWPRATGNFWHRFKSDAFSATYWRYALFSFIFMIVTPFTWTVFLTWIVLILGLPTYALGLIFGFNGDQPDDILIRVFPDLPLSSITIDAAIYGLAFVIGLVALPWILQGLVSLHRPMDAPLLGRSRSEKSGQEVSSLRQSRTATNAESESLRTLERNIHDGLQQQLLRIQLDLEAATRRNQTAPEEAWTLIEDARNRSPETLDELRRLSKGIAPPLLLDRGLSSAVLSLAERNPIPTKVVDRISQPDLINDAIAKNACFIISELYSNAIKHPGASHIETRLDLAQASGLDTKATRGRILPMITE